MKQMSAHRRPAINIPQGARPAVNPSPSSRLPPNVVFLTGPEPGSFPNWEDDWDADPPTTPRHDAYNGPRRASMVDLHTDMPVLDRSRTVNPVVDSSAVTRRLLFPEPQIYRSSSSRPSIAQNSIKGHRASKSDLGHPTSHPSWDTSETSLLSTTSSYGQGSYEPSISEESNGIEPLSDQELITEEGLFRFQEGKLPDKDQEWHRLVPVEARDALGKQEVQRQSVLFEVFKAEREYVADLEAVQDVFVDRLRNASPPIISKDRVAGFISEVFGNLPQILAYHQRMLAALFARQREQHPLIQSVADIVLDTVLKADFRSTYEAYIKHYPLSESHHRKELKRNPAYQAFIQSASSDRRIKKRDLVTFLSRPVTRLPRLNLLLEQILKLTDKEYEHPDLETLPITISILNDCIKSTQPGIEAAEGKVKFWALCESLVYQKGEIIDMDLYDDNRTLLFSGPLARRSRDEWSGWTDLTVALLDNHLLFTSEETTPNGSVTRHLTSRPLPLVYLRLGSFDSPPETRKEHANDGRLLDNLRYVSTPVYPFTIYHATSKSNRRYTLFATSEALRKKWHDKLVDALAISKARHDGNMWFDPRTLTDRMVKINGGGKESTGRPLCAVTFSVAGGKWMAMGTPTGIYVAVYGDSNFRKVLHTPNITSMSAIDTCNGRAYNLLIVHFEGALLSYSLDAIVRVASGQRDASAKVLDGSLERIDTGVVFFRAAIVGKRALVIYGSKRKLQSTPTLTVLEAVDLAARNLSPNRQRERPSIKSFKMFGEPGYIPKDAYDITPLIRKIAVSTQDGMVIADPTNIAKSNVSLIPEWADSVTNAPMASLKTRAESSRPLGIVRCEKDQLLMIYDTMGFYVTKHGKPTRASGYIKWESKAIAYANRGSHVLLFSPQFIEIRCINTGRLVQAIEGSDIRLLYSGPSGGFDSTILVAMKAEHHRMKGEESTLLGTSIDKVVELAETSEVASVRASEEVTNLWDEWDM